jgi:hypothetical protein
MERRLKMKRIFFVISCVCFSYLYAQDNCNRLSYIGDKWQQYHCDTIISEGPAGTNQAWTFNSIAKIFILNSQVEVVLPSSTPYAGTFTAANQAYAMADGYYQFNKVTDSNIIVLGAAQNNPVSQVTKILRWTNNVSMVCPFHYGESFTDTADYVDTTDSHTVAGLTITKHHQVATTTFDAYGVLTLPWITMYKANRYKVDITMVDSIQLPSFPTLNRVVTNHLVEYHWKDTTSSIRGAGFQINYNLSTGKKSVDYNEFFASGHVIGGINHRTNSELITVRPSNSGITFELSSQLSDRNYELMICDMHGKMLLKKMIVPAHEVVIGNKVLPKGLCFYKINGMNSADFRGVFILK